MIRAHRCLLLIILLALAAGIASAQVQTGMPRFGSFGGGRDVINLANLNSHITIPVLHKAGRGMSFDYDLSYDTSVWYPTSSGSSQSWQPVQNWGWRGQTEIATGYVSYNTQVNNICVQGFFNPCGACFTYINWVYHDPFGASHPFSGSLGQTCGGCCGNTGTSTLTSTATDGSGYKLNASATNGSTPSATITSPSGEVFSPPLNGGGGSGVATDRNGNQISVSSTGIFTDTLGTTALSVSGTAPNPTTFTYTAPSGASASYTMKYTAYTVQTKFNCSGGGGIGEYGPTSNSLVSEIDLPDYNATSNPNSRYTLTYETTPGDTHNPPYVTGRLIKVTLPTGGAITYTYTGGNNGIICADGSASGLTRTLSDGAGWTATWTYARTLGTGAASATLITAPQLPYDPAANQTIVQFQGIYETQRDLYQGSAPVFSSLPISESTLQTSNLLQETQTCYNGSATPCTGTAVALPIAQRKVTTLVPGGLQSEHDDFWNTYGGPTEVDEYDYGAAPHGPLLKKILATYAALGNITAFRQTVTTCNGTGTSPSCNGTGTPVAQIKNNYDETNPTPSSNTPQDISVSGPWGNLTSTNIYVNASTFITKSSTYYDTGMKQTDKDVNGATTTYKLSGLRFHLRKRIPNLRQPSNQRVDPIRDLELHRWRPADCHRRKWPNDDNNIRRRVLLAARFGQGPDGRSNLVLLRTCLDERHLHSEPDPI